MKEKPGNELRKIGFSFLFLFFLFFILGSGNFNHLFKVKTTDSDIFFHDKRTKLDHSESIVLVENDVLATKSKITEIKLLKDTSELVVPVSNGLAHKYNMSSICDTCSGERVLLVGDSELDGLLRPVHEYCVTKGHKLAQTVIWYGSHTKHWSQTDTLDYYVKLVKPTAIIITIGLNELYACDLNKRRSYIQNIVKKFKSYNVKYFWVGPAAWVKDQGITKVMSEELGDRFYPSHLLTLERSKDKRHPSFPASKIWFDSVAIKISSLGEIDFSRKNKPTNVRLGSVVMLKVPRF